jgi:hypothetical protein
MQKIISLFQRNYDGDRLVRDEVVPGTEWVLDGEGVATRKFDGTCCMVRDGRLFKRYDAKQGKQPPNGFEPAQEPDEQTGHWPGWLPVGDGPEDRWHREAFERGVDSNGIALASGDYFGVKSYELCGPKVQGNPDRFESHVLVPHGGELLPDAPRTFALIRHYFESHDIEGIVWHHPDGRMVKIKAKDFGLKRGVMALHASADG